MNKRELFKFFCYMFLAVCFIVLIILGICSFFYYLIPIDFPGTVGEWITALSTLAGGALTLGGVWWTIKKQEEQREKDLAIQYRPFFRPIVPMKIDGNSFEENAFPSNSTEHSFETNYTKDIIVKIKNSGRGEAIIKDITNDISISQTDKIRVRINNDLNDCIFPKQYFKLELNITIYDYKCLKSSDMYYDFPITIEYTDFLKQNSYKEKICVLIKNTTSDKENNQNTPTKFVVSIQEPLIKEDEEE